MTFVHAFRGALLFGAFNMGWIFVVLWGFEKLWPRGNQAELPDMLRALKYWGVYLLAGAFIAALFGVAIGPRTPLIYIPVRQWLHGSWMLYILGPLAFSALYDFFNYWMHRAQHKWFWRQHSVHHSIENLSGMNSYFHWTEDLFRIAFISLPMAFVLGLDPGKSAVSAALLTTIHGNFLHSSTRLHLGPLGLLIADNRWHRIHHSIEPKHFDKNFGTSVTWWDHLFGTAYVPGKEWPKVGVHDQPEFVQMRDYLWPWSNIEGQRKVGGPNAGPVEVGGVRPVGTVIRP